MPLPKNFDPLHYIIAQNIVILAQNQTVIALLKDRSPQDSVEGINIQHIDEEVIHRIASVTLREIGVVSSNTTAEIAAILKSLFGYRF